MLKDYQGRDIRLTQERLYHILEHPEMQDQEARISETLLMPDSVVLSHNDAQVGLYHKLYTQTPVTQKYLMVVVKILQDDAFVITGFFTEKEKKGVVLWPQ
jgi:hypothetical protein